MTNQTSIYVGIDISKDHLDVYIDQTDQTFRVTNTQDGVESLVSSGNSDRVNSGNSGRFKGSCLGSKFQHMRFRRATYQDDYYLGAIHDPKTQSSRTTHLDN